MIYDLTNFFQLEVVHILRNQPRGGGGGGGRGFRNDDASVIMCKTDYGGAGGCKNCPKNDYVICERPLGNLRLFYTHV